MDTQSRLKNVEILSILKDRGYTIGKKIGKGTHARVHLAKFIDKATGKKLTLACKTFDKNKAPVDFVTKFFPEEFKILTKIQNPHIIEMHSILQIGSRIFIFMGYAENGDLLRLIQEIGPIPEHHSKLWFKQMAYGLQYLHKLNIAHRDLKCENILLSRRFHVKLADFGFARYCVNEDGKHVLSQTYCGSPAYAAPEIVANTPYNPKLADVWSLGVILYTMLNADMPFSDLQLKLVLKKQMNKSWSFHPNVSNTLSLSAKNIVRQILEPDITLRLNLNKVLKHEWVTSKDKPNNFNSEMCNLQPTERHRHHHHHHQDNEVELFCTNMKKVSIESKVKDHVPMSMKLGLKPLKPSSSVQTKGKTVDD